MASQPAATDAVLSAIRIHEHADAAGAPPGITLLPFALTTLGDLAARAPAATASIHVPARSAGSDRHHDDQQARHLANEARVRLEALVGAARAAAIVAPALALFAQPAFWSRPDAGLALFCTGDECLQVWIPALAGARVLVGAHCDLKPLMQGLQEDGRFYLLELTPLGVHFHAGSRSALLPLVLPGAPTGPGAADAHHGPVGRVAHGGAGEGQPRHLAPVLDERTKLRIKQHFRLIDASVCAFLHGERAPLVTAGAEQLLPLYWEVNRYPHLIEAGISGNPDLMPTAALGGRAWEIVAPHFARAADEARERYLELRGSARVSEDLGTILRAAQAGRVEDLFIAGDSERWGTWSGAEGRLREHEPRQAEDEDLLNLALITGLTGRAHVRVLSLADMPGGCDVAAVLHS